jgi:hypothetical protein
MFLHLLVLGLAQAPEIPEKSQSKKPIKRAVLISFYERRSWCFKTCGTSIDPLSVPCIPTSAIAATSVAVVKDTVRRKKRYDIKYILRASVKWTQEPFRSMTVVCWMQPNGLVCRSNLVRKVARLCHIVTSCSVASMVVIARTPLACSVLRNSRAKVSDVISSSSNA